MLQNLQLDLKQLSIEDPGEAMARMKARLQVTSPLFNDLLILQARFRKLEREQDLGMLDASVYQVQYVQVQKAFLSLVDRVRLEDLVEPEKPPSRSGADDRSHARHFPWYAKRPYWMKSFNKSVDTDGIFEAYEDPPWTARFTDGGYELFNPDDPDKVRYIYLRIGERDMARSAVSVEARLQEGDNGPGNGIGLIFCYQRQQAHYYLYMLNNHGEYKLWLKNADGYQNLTAGRSSHIQPGGFNRLGMLKVDDHLFLFINEQFVREVKDGTLPSGDAGILASGKGHFFFDNLAFYDTDL